jgi:hypothetical protein
MDIERRLTHLENSVDRLGIRVGLAVKRFQLAEKRLAVAVEALEEAKGKLVLGSDHYGRTTTPCLCSTCRVVDNIDEALARVRV